MNAPIILFAFNRPKALMNAINHLLENSEACESDLYVYVDGPRLNNESDIVRVEEVKEIVAKIEGFRSCNIKCASENLGLSSSIILGVSEVINKYGKVIVLEDDLCVTTNFLAFMNQGLGKYENVNRVYSICGYTNRVEKPIEYTYDSYFCTRSSSWGWATWKNRWDTVDWLLDEDKWNTFLKSQHDFNKWGGSDMSKILKGWHDGKNKSWAIRFDYNQFLNKSISLFPLKSLVDNQGFDGDGTNCKKWSRFKFDLDKSGRKNLLMPDDLNINNQLFKEALAYSSIPIRIWSRIMYMIH